MRKQNHKTQTLGHPVASLHQSMHTLAGSRATGPHHTSRKRELPALEWKGSDHMRRKSPFR